MNNYKDALRVWQRNFLYFKKTWLVSLFWTVLEPLVYLGAIGFGLGAFVSNIQGLSYLEFFFPALLCTTAMMVAFFEATYGNYTKLTYQKTYATMMLTPLGPEEIVVGELFWGASKGSLGVVGVLIISFFFGLIDSWKILLTLPVLFLVSWFFSCFGMIMTSYAKNYDSFIFSVSGIIVPMSLFSGTYFPLEQLPFFIRIFTYLLPLTHAVQLTRDILFLKLHWYSALSLVYLVVSAVFLARFAIRRIQAKLLK
ncbi:MAG: ABC transporter permease [Pseudobdellovibrionaceae bacterium]